MLCLTSIHVLIFVTHLHPGDVSDPSRSLELHLNSIHVQSQNHPDLKMCVSPISRPCLICIQVSRFLHQLLQCIFSTPFRPRKMQINLIQAHIKLILVSGCVLHLRQCPASPTSRSQNSCLISIHVPAHYHPGPKIPISPSSMYSSTSTWVTTLVSHLQAFASHIQPGLSFVSLLHPGHI